METETFNKAKEILSKYAPEKLDKKEQPQSPMSRSIVGVSATSQRPLSELRKRNVVQEVKPGGATAPAPATSLAMVPHTPSRPGTAPKQRLPQPVFPQERGLTDKLIEFMIGDGPGYRYALICNHCRGHNGMALKEEFPYMAFNCCYCYQYNPARSKRPVPPKLADVKELPSQVTPALPAPKQLDTSQTPISVQEETMRANDNVLESGEKRIEELPEADRNDLKMDDETDIQDINDEKSDDDFQSLGFSKSDLDFLKKLSPEAPQPDEEIKEEPCVKEF